MMTEPWAGQRPATFSFPQVETKAAFRAIQRLGVVFFPAFDWAISATHPEREERLLYTRDQLVEEGRLLPQLVAVADGAADDAALHIAAALVAGDHTVADQKRRGADVVGNHFQRGVGEVATARDLRRFLDQPLEQIDLVVAVHVLQDGGQPLQAHAGVHAGRGELGEIGRASCRERVSSPV